MTGQVIFWLLAALALTGALVVVLTREVMRMALGLGAFLLSLSGFFALYGFGFLALAEVFIYAGGVLVLLLFAIMLVHRSDPGRPTLETRHDLLAAVSAAGIAGLVSLALRPVVTATAPSGVAGPDELGAVLLGRMLPHLELAGLLLLAALVAVVAVGGGDGE